MGSYYADIYNSYMAVNSIIIVIIIVGLIIVIPCIIAWCKIFRKADIPWERVFVPFYNVYTTYSLAKCTPLFWIFILAPLAGILLNTVMGNDALSKILTVIAIIIHAIHCKSLACVFGKGIGWAIGLFLLYPFFIIGLGFGKAEYLNDSNVNGDA